MPPGARLIGAGLMPNAASTSGPGADQRVGWPAVPRSRTRRPGSARAADRRRWPFESLGVLVVGWGTATATPARRREDQAGGQRRREPRAPPQARPPRPGRRRRCSVTFPARAAAGAPVSVRVAAWSTGTSWLRPSRGVPRVPPRTSTSGRPAASRTVALAPAPPREIVPRHAARSLRRGSSRRAARRGRRSARPRGRASMVPARAEHVGEREAQVVRPPRGELERGGLGGAARGARRVQRVVAAGADSSVQPRTPTPASRTLRRTSMRPARWPAVVTRGVSTRTGGAGPGGRRGRGRRRRGRHCSHCRRGCGGRARGRPRSGRLADERVGGRRSARADADVEPVGAHEPAGVRLHAIPAGRRGSGWELCRESRMIRATPASCPSRVQAADVPPCGTGRVPNVRRTCSSVEVSSSCVASRVASA